MDDEEKLITQLVQRIAVLVVAWSKHTPGAVQDLARQEELRKQNVASLLGLATTQINVVESSLLQSFNQLNEKYRNLETEEDQAALARARVFFIDLMARCLAANWNALKEKVRDTIGQVEEASDQEGRVKQKLDMKEQEERVLPQPVRITNMIPEKERSKEDLPGLFEVAARYLLGSPGPHSGNELREKAGRLLFQFSGHNWDEVWSRIASGLGSQDENATPANLIEHLHPNSQRLSQLIAQMNKAVDDGAFKKTNMQLLLSRVLVRVIWNWIDHYPVEFVTLSKGTGKLRGDPDRLFDTYVNWGGKKKNGDFWEVETMLLILCPDIMRAVVNQQKGAKDIANKEKFIAGLNKALKGKLADVAVVCFVDMCKASTFVRKEEMSPIRHIVVTIENELGERLFNPQAVFKTSQGNEVELMTNSLLSSFRLSHRKVVNSTFTDILKSSSYSPIFKTVLVNTLQRIVDEGAALPWYPTITDVYSGLSSLLRAQFQEYEQQTRGYAELVKLNDKKSKAQAEKIAKDIEVLTRLINLFHSDPILALHTTEQKSAAANLEETRNLLTGLCSLTAMFSLPELSQAAGNALLALHQPAHIGRWCTSNVLLGFWDISSAVNISLSNVLIERRDLRTVDIHHLISILNQILAYRNSFLEVAIHQHKDKRATDSGDGSRVSSSTQLEIALLIHLCSAETEIVSKVLNCFGRLCDEIDIVAEADSDNAISANYHVYRKLANSSNPGRAAQQRAIRIELRRIRQTAGNFAAWEQVHQRWVSLTAFILRGGDHDSKAGGDYHSTIKKLAKAQVPKLPERSKGAKPTMAPPIAPEKVNEWNHYSGFLCAAAGVTLNKLQVKVEQTRKDRQTTETKVQVSSMFIRELLGLIVAEHDMIRETTTELAGSTLSPAVYPVLFQCLNRKVGKLFGREGQIQFTAHSTTFVDQAISIIKHIMELPVDQHTREDLAAVDEFENLITSLVKYVSGLVTKDNPSIALRVRNKMCGCLDAMMAKLRYISFKNELPFRENLVELILEWISDFSAKPAHKPTAAYEGVIMSEEKRKEVEKLMQDVDVAALRAISSLLRELPLPKEDADVDTSALRKYFTFFTNLIKTAKADNAEGQVQQAKAEYAVAALSNLLSANLDSALEYFVTMGYHEDLETRAAFLKVLTNILNQGSSQFDSNPQEGRYSKLLQLVLEMDVVLALSSVIQITEADDVAQLLVRLFEANERTMDLLRKAIKQEVNKTETENTLFRRNSMATKLLAAYSKLIGTRYLRDTLTPVIQSLIAKPVPLELDPAKLTTGQDRQKNLENVTRVSGDFLKAIIMATENCPLPFREICHFLKTQVGKRFPGAEHSAIGGFFMLRYLCPAIVAPDGFSLVQPIALSTDLRRGLVLVTKVLQNLANKVMFNKEPHMEEMNTFLKENMPAIEALFDEMANVPEDAEPVAPIHVPEEQKEEDLANLHYHLAANLDKIQRVLLAPDSKDGPNVFLRLSSILGQLGPPPEPSRTTKFGGATEVATNKKGGANTHHTGFMEENAKLDVKALDAARIFYKQGQSKDKAAVFYFIARKFEQNWTQDQLIFYIMKTLQPELGKPFSIVVDLTLFNKDTEIAVNWFSRFRHVAPNTESLDKIFLLHANYEFKKYSKKIAKSISRIRSKMVFVASVKELQAYIPEKELALPTSTLAVEKDVKSTFSPVQKLMQYNNQKEVIVKISNSLFEVLTVKQHNIFGRRVPLLDLVHIASIFEINISEDASEFVLKYDKDEPKTATYRTPAAEQIIVALRASKARYNLSKTEESINANKRAFRAADVPGTLLNMALLNLGNTNAELRVEAYNLLAALCSSFNLSVQTSLWAPSGLCIPRNTNTFIEDLSRKLADTASHLTLEFLQESLHGIEKIKANLPGKQLSLNYITYWLPNLKLFVRPSPAPDASANLEKTRAIVLQFIDFTIRETSMTGPAIQSKVWEVLGAVPEVLDTVIDCLLERATDKKQGVASTALTVVGDIFVSLASQNARLVAGKLLAKLLNVLSLTNGAKMNRLDEHPVWLNIVVLLRVLLMLSFENLLCVADYLPELFFVVLLLFSTGASIVRATVHGLLINVVHSLYMSNVSQGRQLPSLKLLLSELDQQKTRVLFGLGGLSISAFSKMPEKSSSLEGAPMSITTVETVAGTLLSILNYCSPTNNCLGTVWHARFLSLTTRMAYTTNSALQPRAIIGLGVFCHAPSLVTDDLMAQVLRTLLEVIVPLSSPGQKLDGDLPISLIICITRLFEHVTYRSKFFKPMFWLAMTLLEIDDPSLFAVAISLLEVVLKTLDAHNCFADGIVAYCMTAREECSLEDVLARADALTGISFKTSFSFAVAAHLLKGLRRPATKTATARVLATFVDIAAKKAIGSSMLGYIATLLPIKGDEMENLRQLLLPAGEASSLHQYLFTDTMLPDTLNAALLFTLLVTILKSSDSEHEQQFIYEALKEGVHMMPEAFPVVYDVLIPKMAVVIQNSQNAQIIDACLNITEFMFSPNMEAIMMSKKRLQKDYLASRAQFQGLFDADSFQKPGIKTDQIVKIACLVVEQMLKQRN